MLSLVDRGAQCRLLLTACPQLVDATGILEAEGRVVEVPITAQEEG